MIRHLALTKTLVCTSALLFGCNADTASSDIAGPNLERYTSLSEIGRLYRTDKAFNPKQGTLSVWMKFAPNHSRRDHLIFSTDDSRYVLFVDTYNSSSSKQSILRIGARAGGNRRVVDSRYQGGNFPEASIVIDNDGRLANYGKTTPWYSSVPFPMGEWQHVAMTWQGQPQGKVRIYLNGRLIGDKPYDERYDDGRKAATSMIVGRRPRNWTGELTQLPTGETIESVPKTTMQLAKGGIAIQDLRLYRAALPENRILELKESNSPK